MAQIPSDFVNYRSSASFTKESVPKLLLYSHNTKDGVYGEIVVEKGRLKFFGLVENKGKVDKEVIIEAGDVAISPPQYWHRVEFLTEDTVFKINFYAQKDSATATENLSERSPV